MGSCVGKIHDEIAKNEYRETKDINRKRLERAELMFENEAEDIEVTGDKCIPELDYFEWLANNYAKIKPMKKLIDMVDLNS